EGLEESKGIATLKENFGIKTSLARASESLPVGNGSGGGAIAVYAVSAGAKHHDRLARDFFQARKNESRVAAAESVAGNRGAEFTIGDQRDWLAGIGSLQLF